MENIECNVLLEQMDYIKAIEFISEDSRIAKIIYQITRQYIPKQIFKYYSLTDEEELNRKKLDTLRNKEVYLSEAKDFNDPFDNRAYYYKNERLMKYDRLKPHNGMIFDDMENKLLLSSFSKIGNNSLPMWAHYTNNYQGYCVMYDTESIENSSLKVSMFPVQYIDKRIDITCYLESLMDETLEKIKKTKVTGEKIIKISNMTLPWITILFSCLKEVNWKYEQELRCIVPKSNNESRVLSAVPSEIYVGMNCSNENIRKLKKISEELEISIYRMKEEKYSSDYCLTTEKL